MKDMLKRCWALLRQLSGDDAYERYVRHQKLAHPDKPLLDRKSFFQREQERKWNGIKRCC